MFYFSVELIVLFGYCCVLSFCGVACVGVVCCTVLMVVSFGSWGSLSMVFCCVF